MVRSPTRTAVLSTLRRAPPQLEQRASARNCPYQRLARSEPVCLKRRIRRGSTPSHSRSKLPWPDLPAQRTRNLRPPVPCSSWPRKPCTQPVFSETFGPHGLIAPSSSDRSGSGITSSGSISTRVPSPLQSAHMPCGLLNEKAWGVSSGKEQPQCEHEALSEKTRSGPPSIAASSVPCPTRSAASTESVSRPRIPRRTTMRSITASRVCFRRLSRAASSSLRRISPSTRSRVQPERRADSSRSRCSPLRFTSSGASRRIRVPSARDESSRAICSAVWASTRRPQR
jgi:hypothetical protein